MPSLIDQTKSHGTAECRRWRAEIFDRHWRIANELAAGYLYRARLGGIDGNRDGNNWLRVQDQRLRFGRANASAAMDDDEIRIFAESKAKAVDKLFQQLASRQDLDTVTEIIKSIVTAEGLTWPADLKPNDSPTDARKKQAGALARVRDPLWWRRAIRKTIGRQVERVLRESGAVRKSRSPYISPWAFSRWQSTQQRNRNTLSNFIAVADDGDEVPLIDCIDASVSNPVNRRNELMVRMRGWEDIADALHLQGAMLTLTAPSQFHAIHFSGARNEKFNGSTPNEAQQYLNGVWSRIRAEWHRNGIKAIGFRICEPHHDGTPHFHFLLFFGSKQLAKAWEIFRKHALAIDGDEPGAAEHRCDCKLIDKSKGSATGYIAKYVAKNIDGYGFNGDEVDNEGDIFANEGAARVRAWASLWGIRQFQQIGNASVTVWRELRRQTRPLDECHPEQLEAARAAADKGNWQEYVDAMGGAFVRRDEQLLRPLKTLSEKPGRYGDEVRRILGLVMRASANELNHFLQTRTKNWKIVPRWALENIRDRGLP